MIQYILEGQQKIKRERINKMWKNETVQLVLDLRGQTKSTKARQWGEQQYYHSNILCLDTITTKQKQRMGIWGGSGGERLSQSSIA